MTCFILLFYIVGIYARIPEPAVFSVSVETVFTAARLERGIHRRNQLLQFNIAHRQFSAGKTGSH